MKMKNSIIMALMTMAVTTAGAQEKKTIELPTWLNNVKLSGYGMTQYQYSGQKGKESNSFQHPHGTYRPLKDVSPTISTGKRKSSLMATLPTWAAVQEW